MNSWYGMFTESGNEMIADLVAFANKYQLSDKSVVDALWAIAETEGFAEASDTVVRENVFAALTQGAF